MFCLNQQDTPTLATVYNTPILVFRTVFTGQRSTVQKMANKINKL